MNNYALGTVVELISKANLAKMTTNDLVNLGLTSKEIARNHSKLSKIPLASIGTVIDTTDVYCEIAWENGTTTIVLNSIDFIRPVTAPVLVYGAFERFHMSEWEMAQWANKVHQMAGGKGEPFTASEMPKRLMGHHCSCGVNNAGYSRGVFKLLSMYSDEVKIGCKPYMVCKKCGGMSHL